MDQTVEAVVDGFSDHFSTGDQFGVQSMKNVLQILSFTGLFRVEQFEELLDEGRSDVDFESLDVCSVVDDQLQEELVNWLQVWPGGVDQKLLLRFRKSLLLPCRHLRRAGPPS